MPTAMQLSAFLFCTLGAACTPAPPTFEPVYEACATDENWISFDDYEKTGRVTATGNMVPQWNGPLMGATIPAAMPPVFQWQPSASRAGAPNGDATCPQYQPASVAVNHLPPVSGTVYDLHFAVDGSDAYRVVTTRQRTGVPANVFAGWSGKTVTATLYVAKLLINSIAEGPYQAAPLLFLVSP